jgi:RHS repeat-associated protein
MYMHGRSGLNLTMFRQYNSSLGRWLSRDPIGEAGGVNLYGYCFGDPISWIDPLGLVPNTYMYKSADEAAKSGFNENRNFVDASRRSGYEMGFWVYSNGKGKYAYSNPFLSNSCNKEVTSQEAKNNIPSWISPAALEAFSHTHPEKRPLLSDAIGYENFSKTDVDTIRYTEIPGYLLNAYDQFKYYDGAGNPNGTLMK